jgi:phosphonate transport system substrate-binding protein
MQPLRFVTGPVHLDEDGDDLREDLSAALSDALERPVVVVAQKSYRALAESVGGREADLAWLPPVLFVRAFDARVVAHVLRADRGHAGYQGAIFVRSDSPIEGAAGLKDASIAWVDRDSAAGFLFPRSALRDAGLDPASLFASESFVNSHSKSVRTVLQGAADAGATFVQLAEPGHPELGIAIAGWTGFAPTDALRAVVVSASIPGDTVCVLAGVADGGLLRDGLARFHEHPEGAALLGRLLDAQRLVPADGSEYAAVRRALDA